MIGKKYLQLPLFKTNLIKPSAVLALREYVQEHSEEFLNGEEVGLSYLGYDGEEMYSTAIIKVSGGTADVYVSVDESETLRIVESNKEPVDKTVLWLSEGSNEDESSASTNLREELSSLKETLKSLKALVEKHDYALSSTIAGGDIILNSTKYELENETETEKPEDAVDYTEYAEDDLAITSFEVYIGNSPLTRFSGADASLYGNQNYFLKLKLYNIGGEQVREDDSIILSIQHGQEISYNQERRLMVGIQTGYTTVYATISDGNGLSLTNTYPIKFEYNEEPGYETFSEPNVRHVILKSVQNLQILVDNINYLCINEPIWCISECALYIKGEMPNGGVGLFKINGGGGDIPITGDTTGDTTSVTYEAKFTLENNILQAISSNNAIFVDEDGILNINVGSVEDEILILNDVTTTGTTPDPQTGSTTSDESSVNVDPSSGSADFGGATSVDSNGILSLNAVVNENGILQITA